MEVRTAASPKDVKHYTTDRLRGGVPDPEPVPGRQDQARVQPHRPHHHRRGRSG